MGNLGFVCVNDSWKSGFKFQCNENGISEEQIPKFRTTKKILHDACNLFFFLLYKFHQIIYLFKSARRIGQIFIQLMLFNANTKLLSIWQFVNAFFLHNNRCSIVFGYRLRGLYASVCLWCALITRSWCV